MGRSQETFNKKEVRNKKEKKRKEKEKKRLAKKDSDKRGMDDMIAYVDEKGRITSTPPDPEEKEEVNAEDIVLGVPSRGEMDEEDLIRKGTVTFFNDSKGYGFIKDANTKESIFVHINNVDGDLKEGNKVAFEVEQGMKGPTAVKVAVVK